LRGHLTSVTNDFHVTGPNPFVTQYGYDEFGNLILQTDAASHATLFSYNKLGQRTRRTLPGTQFEQFAYDAVGNQVKHTNFLGKVTTFQYDKLNRLLQKIPDATNRFRGLRSLHCNLKNFVPPSEHSSQQFQDALVMETLQYFKRGKHSFCMLGRRVCQPGAELFMWIAPGYV